MSCEKCGDRDKALRSLRENLEATTRLFAAAYEAWGLERAMLQGGAKAIEADLSHARGVNWSTELIILGDELTKTREALTVAQDQHEEKRKRLDEALEAIGAIRGELHKANEWGDALRTSFANVVREFRAVSYVNR